MKNNKYKITLFINNDKPIESDELESNEINAIKRAISKLTDPNKIYQCLNNDNDNKNIILAIIHCLEKQYFKHPENKEIYHIHNCPKIYHINQGDINLISIEEAINLNKSIAHTFSIRYTDKDEKHKHKHKHKYKEYKAF